MCCLQSYLLAKQVMQICGQAITMHTKGFLSISKTGITYIPTIMGYYYRPGQCERDNLRSHCTVEIRAGGLRWSRGGPGLYCAANYVLLTPNTLQFCSLQAELRLFCFKCLDPGSGWKIPVIWHGAGTYPGGFIPET